MTNCRRLASGTWQCSCELSHNERVYEIDGAPGIQACAVASGLCAEDELQLGDEICATLRNASTVDSCELELSCGRPNGGSPGSSGRPSGGASGGSSDGGSSDTGGTAPSGGKSGTGGTTSTGGKSSSTGGSASSGAPSTGGSGGCTERSTVTVAVHAVIPVTWPGTLGTQAGKGNFHSWNRLTWTTNGTALSGRSSPCGSTLPPLGLTVLVGGGMSLLEIPTTVWDMPSFPDFPSTGTLSSFSTGGKLKTNPSTSLIGSSMSDPDGAWPGSYTEVMPVDMDDDDNPGITSIPRLGGGYNPPPVSIVGPRAQSVYLTSRTALALDGELGSCTDISGAAKLEKLDSHVLGCARDDGQACTAAQTDFLDDNRTLYSTMPGTFTAKIVEDGTTCAEIREALPM